MAPRGAVVGCAEADIETRRPAYVRRRQQDGGRRPRERGTTPLPGSFFLLSHRPPESPDPAGRCAAVTSGKRSHTGTESDCGPEGLVVGLEDGLCEADIRIDLT